jgi:hypothetical protein
MRCTARLRNGDRVVSTRIDELYALINPTPEEHTEILRHARARELVNIRNWAARLK